MESLYDDNIISITSNGTIENNFGIPLDLSTQGSNNNRKLPTASDSDSVGYEDEYLGPQLLMRSNKIVIDSRQQPLTLSSGGGLLFGSLTDTKIYTNNSTIIESKNIYLGESAVDESEPLVLGTQLVEVIDKLINAIGLLFVGGTVGGISVPINASNSPGWLDMDKKIRNELSQILSKHHYIEKNTPGGKK